MFFGVSSLREVRAIILFIPMALSAIVGYSLAQEPGEPHLALKLGGYAVLGYLSVRAGAVTLPAGFLVALLLLSRARMNRRSRFAACALTCLLWGLGFA